ncbi:pfkB family carbohydrate kinase [compost metagenome]
MNKNESKTIHNILFEETEINFREQGKKIYRKLPISILVIHNAKETHVFENKLELEAKPELIPNPFISTGAGDHFNAGFCYGLLSNFELSKCLVMANLVASYYLKTGISPTINNLIKQ